MSENGPRSQTRRRRHSPFALVSATMALCIPLIAVVLAMLMVPGSTEAGKFDSNFMFGVLVVVRFLQVAMVVGILSVVGSFLAGISVFRSEQRRRLAWSSLLVNGTWCALVAWVLCRNLEW